MEVANNGVVKDELDENDQFIKSWKDLITPANSFNLPLSFSLSLYCRPVYINLNLI